MICILSKVTSQKPSMASCLRVVLKQLTIEKMCREVLNKQCLCFIHSSPTPNQCMCHGGAGAWVSIGQYCYIICKGGCILCVFSFIVGGGGVQPPLS